MVAGGLSVALLAALAAPPADRPADSLAARLLAAHNHERDAVGVPRLRWDETLAGHARLAAARLARLGYLAHGEDDPDEAPEGENLWAGTRRHFSPEEMVGFWSAERRRYRGGRFPDVSVTGAVSDVGHYTQMVWRATTAIGCAVADDGDLDYLVCRYAEAGNMFGESVF